MRGPSGYCAINRSVEVIPKKTSGLGKFHLQYPMPTMELFFFGFTLWLAPYMLARNSQKVTVNSQGGIARLRPRTCDSIIFNHSSYYPARACAAVDPPALIFCPMKTKAVKCSSHLAITSIPLAILTLLNAGLPHLLFLYSSFARV